MVEFGVISTGLEHRCHCYLNNLYSTEVCNGLLVIKGWLQPGSRFIHSRFTVKVAVPTTLRATMEDYNQARQKQTQIDIPARADIPRFYFLAVTNLPEFLTFC